MKSDDVIVRTIINMYIGGFTLLWGETFWNPKCDNESDVV